MKPLNWAEQVQQDVVFGARNLAANPAFTVPGVLSLALGIMATTAMYGVVHAVLLDPFPYRDVDHLMTVRISNAADPDGRTFYSTDEFLEIAERNSIFDGVIGSVMSDLVWTSDGEAQMLRANHVTTNTFEVMGVPPLLGRAITRADGAPDATLVVVLGYGFWQAQFGGDAGVLGRELRLNGVLRTVVGVMPRRFVWRAAEIYVPVVFKRGKGEEEVRLFGRLKPGVTRAHAESDLRSIIAELEKKEPGHFGENWRVGLLSFKETFPSDIGGALWILFGAAGLLLLIACVNVTNLLLARAAARQREMAVRAALGAGTVRLFGQTLTESLLLAVAGAACGVLFAHWGLRAVIVLVPPETIPPEADIAINSAVLAFTVGVVVLTAVSFGVAPAWQAARTNLVEALKEGNRSVAGSQHTLVRNGLAVAEVALAVMLLVGASLMMRTLFAMQKVDLGIRTDRLLSMRIPLLDQRYAGPVQRTAFFHELLERLRTSQIVVAAGVNTGVHPFGNSSTPVEIAGSPRLDNRPVVLHQVSEDYTRTLGITLLKGRLFTEADMAGRRRVVLVNEAFVRRYLTEREPLGQVVRLPQAKTPLFNLADDYFQVIGVVRDAFNSGMTNDVEPELYLPYTLTGLAEWLVVLPRADLAAVTSAIRSQVRAMDKEQPIIEVRTIESMLDDFVLSGPRFSATLLSIFAALGLSIAVIGVYGVISYGVSRRNREIGVRIAMGASTGNIVRMVVSSGVRLVGAGIVLGLAGSAALARVVQHLIWKVSPLDPVSFALVSGVLLVAGLQACLWPALRAASVDPVSALRDN